MEDALKQAEALQCAAALEGFDWSTLADLWPKLDEEIVELREAATQSTDRRQDELGDLLFMAVNLARHLGVDPRAAMLAANAKFRRRYSHVIAHVDLLPALGAPERLERMEALWGEAKKLGL